MPQSLQPANFPVDPKMGGHAELTDTLGAEIDDLFSMDAMPAMESADVQYPDEILPPEAIQPVDDELADDFIEAQLSTKRGLMPALSDSDETSGFDEDAEPLDLPIQSDLAEQLDFLFSDTALDGNSALTFSALDSNELETALEGEEEPVAALADVDQTIELDTVEIALSGAADPMDQSDFDIGIEETEIDPNSLAIQSQLDSFFADIDEGSATTIATPQETVEENRTISFLQ